MYKHWRYRPLAANLAAYPFYANISEDFERRLDEGARKLRPMTSKVKLRMMAAGKVRSKKEECSERVEQYRTESCEGSSE
jgi:hypothetical protein